MAVVEARRPRGDRRVRPRDDGGDQRAAGAPRRAHGARDDGGLPRRPGDRPPGPARTSTTSRAAARRRSSRASCASRCASGWAPTASCEPLDEDSLGRGGRARCAEADVEAVAVCLLFALPAPGARAARRRGGPRGAARRPRVALERGAAGGARVRALSSTTVADAYLAPRLGGLPARARRADGRRRAARAARHAVLRRRRGSRGRRRARRELRAVGARRAASSAPPTPAPRAGTRTS